MLLEYPNKSTTKFQDSVQLSLKITLGYYQEWNTQFNEKSKKLTPASTAMGLPSRSSSASSSSTLLLINEVILGILALITDSKCWDTKHSNIWAQIKQWSWTFINKTKFYPWEKFCEVLRTHFTCQVPIVRTCSKVLTFISPCSHHINIPVDICLWTINNTNPWLL